MNRNYRSIWNIKTGTFVAVSENASSAGKDASLGTTTERIDTRVDTRFILKALSFSIMVLCGANAYALPVGGVVSAGGASISTGAGSVTITQSTPTTAINWQSFNIGSKEAVQFVQPNSSSVALNRVMGSDPSSILGSLSANGKVFLINPNGILFGLGAEVNVGGLVASTLNISDSDFMAGNYKFSGNASSSVSSLSGSILNQGTISAEGGYVALLGANVSNQGVITARLGTVALAAGKAMTLDVAGDGLLSVTVNQSLVNALIKNGGLIQADGGQVVLTAQAAGTLLQSAVNNTGVIEARSVANHNGSIQLLGAQSGVVNAGGTLDVSGTGTGQTGGTVHILGGTVNLASASINASGNAGGGEVLIGGSFHGAGPEQNSHSTSLDGNTTIHADALQSGNGGQIAVWSNGKTSTGAVLTARGGANSGVGGFIETSGTTVKLTHGASVNTLAPHGKTGEWLLDPLNYIIGIIGDETPASVTASLATSNRLISATNNITVADPVTWATPQTLTLSAGNDVLVQAAMTAQAAGAGIVLTAAHDVFVSSPMTASGTGSSITMTAGVDVITTAAITSSASGNKVSMTAGRDVNVAVITASGGGLVDLHAGNNVTLNDAITADSGPVTLIAGMDGSGPGVSGGTVSFIGAAVVTAPNTTIRFNPNGYINTSAEIASYASKVSANLDAKAWVFGQASNKTYDGNTTATLGFKTTATSGTPTDGGNVTLIPGTAAFDTKDVGTGKSVTFTGYALGGADAAEFALFASGGVSLANITPASLTITASNVSKTYGQTATLSGFTDTGLVSGDTIGSVTETSLGAVATASVAGSPYAITPSNATGGTFIASNYVIGYVNGALTVTPANLTVTASNATKTYGQTPTLTGFTDVGLVNGDTIGSVTETSPGTAATASVVGSPYAITPSNATGGTFTASNYTIGYVNGALTVTPASLTVTASNVTKSYGQTPALTGFTETGLVNGETIGSVTETSPGQAATASASGSPYIITPSNATGGTFTASNYTIGYVNGTLTIGPANLIVTASNATKTYGQTPTLTGFTETGLVNGDTIGSVTETSPGTAATASVIGSPYAITPSNATGGTFNAANYTIGYVNGALTVTPANLTVTASNVTKSYGQTPALTGFTETGLVNGETIGSVTETSPGQAATASASGSPYVITASNATGGSFTPSNYTIGYVNGTLTIGQASLIVTASNVTKSYGQTPALTGFTETGLVNGDTIGSVTETSPGQVATANVSGSPYVITASNATGGTFVASNYTIGYVNGTLTVKPANVTLTASNVTKVYGQNPTLSGFTETGLVNGDTIGSVTETSAGKIATAGVSGSPYAIIPSNATGGTFIPGNYVIAYVNGALTVLPASLTITASDAYKIYGQTPTLTAFTEVGLVNGETIGSVTETSPGTLPNASVLGNPYLITPSNATGGSFTPSNYTIAYVGGKLTVLPLIPSAPVQAPPNAPPLIPYEIPTTVVLGDTPPQLLSVAPPAPVVVQPLPVALPPEPPATPAPAPMPPKAYAPPQRVIKQDRN